MRQRRHSRQRASSCCRLGLDRAQHRCNEDFRRHGSGPASPCLRMGRGSRHPKRGKAVARSACSCIAAGLESSPRSAFQFNGSCGHRARPDTRHGAGGRAEAQGDLQPPHRGLQRRGVSPRPNRPGAPELSDPAVHTDGCSGRGYAPALPRPRCKRCDIIDRGHDRHCRHLPPGASGRTARSRCALPFAKLLPDGCRTGRPARSRHRQAASSQKITRTT